MPIIKSAKKRVKVARKATIRNSKSKRNLKSALKSFQTSITGGNHAKAQSALDKAGKKGIFHKNKVARKKRQLAAAAKKSGVKLAGTSKAKKTVTKKVVARKPATKKVSSKKTSSKKK